MKTQKNTQIERKKGSINLNLIFFNLLRCISLNFIFRTNNENPDILCVSEHLQGMVQGTPRR